MTRHPESVISLGPRDFVVQTFRAGGKGGQNQKMMAPHNLRIEARDENGRWRPLDNASSREGQS